MPFLAVNFPLVTVLSASYSERI